MSWADKFRKLKIRTNSETPLDTKIAREFGAEGIGLCRTEHMFFDEERILSVREMILSKTKEDRHKALSKLLPHQKNDFIEIFKIMNGLPVTVRLLDPPLHEFLPKNEKEIVLLWFRFHRNIRFECSENNSMEVWDIKLLIVAKISLFRPEYF